MGDIVRLPVITRLDWPADQILESAKGRLEGVVVLGYDADGAEYFTSSYADGADVLWLLKRAEFAILHSADEDQPE